jgi:integrase
VSTRTDDWDEAAEFRDRWEEQVIQAGLEGAIPNAALPTFVEAAADYLANGVSVLSHTGRHDRTQKLDPAGALVARFGHMRADEIRAGDLQAWWDAESLAPRGRGGRGPALSTLLHDLDAVAAVLARADDLYELFEDRPHPVHRFRQRLARRRRTQRGRHEQQAARDTRRPLERVAEVAAFVEASEELYQLALIEQAADRRPEFPASIDGHLASLILLDAGLRLGEACALTWGDLELSERGGPRRLHVRRSYSRGYRVGPPKSGRNRAVDLSRRLVRLLLERRMAAPKAWLFPGRLGQENGSKPGLNPNSYRRRHFDRVCKRAKLGHRSPKDLRDTFASQLITIGAPLAYVSQQLGHSNQVITSTTYAKWCEEANQLARRRLDPMLGELWVDLLERLGESVLPSVQRAQ